MPDVLAMPLDKARSLLAAAGYEIEIMRTENAYKDAGSVKGRFIAYIVRQIELPGKKVQLTLTLKRERRCSEMAFKINAETCIGCGACAANCPVGAPKETEEGKYAITAEECVDCGACAANCPVGAIDQ